jgi:predicted enzyme related to lactoylglutathione lyase
VSKIDYNHQLNCAMEVSDLGRAIEWYTKVLGFSVNSRMDAINFAIMGTPVEGVVLGLSKVDGAPRTNGVSLTWGVTDIDAAEATFKAAGGRPDGPINDIPGVVRLLSFSDPDGNRHQFWAPPLQ